MYNISLFINHLEFLGYTTSLIKLNNELDGFVAKNLINYDIIIYAKHDILLVFLIKIFITDNNEIQLTKIFNWISMINSSISLCKISLNRKILLDNKKFILDVEANYLGNYNKINFVKFMQLIQKELVFIEKKIDILLADQDLINKELIEIKNTNQNNNSNNKENPQSSNENQIIKNHTEVYKQSNYQEYNDYEDFDDLYEENYDYDFEEHNMDYYEDEEYEDRWVDHGYLNDFDDPSSYF